ncbi:MAG: nicotinate-nicotinamide nucleotide adenylyltransferase [Betaproteobacteria bacterium]|nr:nicotinate-nicotinamide nucleotide adenylyltransferase [Betaproteobacteria bacterium]
MSATPAKKRVGILGAAFDPPHYGHLLLAQLALNTQELDEIWLIPSPERWDKKPVASHAHRLAWLTRAAALCPDELRKHLRVSDVELKLPTYRGTHWLLEEMRRQNKGCSFALILGWDSFVGIPQWRDPTTGTMNGAELLATTRCYVSPRASSELPEPIKHPAPHGGGVVMLPALDAPEAGDISWMTGVAQNQVAALSSSLIRTALKSGSDIKFMFPELQKEIIESKAY